MAGNTDLRASTGCVLPLYFFSCREIFRDKRVRQFGSYEDKMQAKTTSDSADGSSDLSVEDCDEDSSRSMKIRKLSSEESLSPGLNSDVARVSEEETSSDSSIVGSTPDFSKLVPGSDSEEESEVPSKFDDAIFETWERASMDGLMKYDVTQCPTKVAEGKYSFILQLNLGRATKKRQTEYRIDQVVQEFDETKFNFTKIRKQECLMQFDPSDEDECTYVAEGEPMRSSSNVILVNVSPIDYGHILLIPRYMKKLPQLVSPSTLHIALQMAVVSGNRYFRIGFNSLGAYGSVNHLHFQAYYMYHPFPIERSPTRCLFEGVVKVSETLDYPVKAFCIEVESSLRELANVVGSLCEYLQEEDQPYNLLICDGGARVFLIPNAFSKRAAERNIPEDVLDTGVNPAAFELSGHIVLKRQEDYDNVNEDFVCRMLSPASVDDVVFKSIVAKFRQILEL